MNRLGMMVDLVSPLLLLLLLLRLRLRLRLRGPAPGCPCSCLGDPLVAPMLTACRGAQAHVSPGTMRAVLDVSVSPVVFSHSNASSICDHPRNVPDDVLDRIPANGGIVMATFVAPFSSWERFQWEGENKTGMGVRRHSVTHTPSIRRRS